MEVDVGLDSNEYSKDNASSLNLNIADEGENVDCGKDPRTNSIAEEDTPLVPCIGMEFNSLEDALSFYTSYAKFVGFGISTKASRRSKLSRQFIDVKFACTRYGVKRESNAINPRPCLKIDCKATLHVKRKTDGKWVIHSFVKEHNHELFPVHAHYFPRRRRISHADKNNIDNLHAVGLGTRKINAAMAKKHGGYQIIGCLEKDLRNHLDKERRLAIESGDARAMLELFMCMQEENPNFFYAMDLDEQQQLRNVFWVDAKGRDNYQNFGDVVSFDTTYITNRYKMPFAPFIGVNNHFQSTLLGCALLADESTSTFVWLMRTWLRAMGGRAPNAIVTDQDKAMKAAIKTVFPNARHQFCMWHILGKVPEKLSHVMKRHEDFMEIFNRCIYKSWTEEQFERRWWAMVERFELNEEEWVQSIYDDRRYWIPTYTRDTFFAGMSTTQRSESISSFFDKYVAKKTTLKDFVDRYKVALEDRLEAETEADFKTWHKKPVLKSPSPFEKQMSALYTHEIFKKFQVEVLGVSGCYPKKENEDGKIKTFKVQDFEKSEDFIVEWDATKEEISCECRSFEFNGFLCRHSLSVLQCLGVFNIPSHYILKRWSKDAKGMYSRRLMSEEVQSKKQRLDNLFQEATRLSEEGSFSPEGYQIAFCAIQEALKKCAAVNGSLKKPTKCKANDNHDVNKENMYI